MHIWQLGTGAVPGLLGLLRCSMLAPRISPALHLLLWAALEHPALGTVRNKGRQSGGVHSDPRQREGRQGLGSECCDLCDVRCCSACTVPVAELWLVTPVIGPTFLHIQCNYSHSTSGCFLCSAALCAVMRDVDLPACGRMSTVQRVDQTTEFAAAQHAVSRSPTQPGSVVLICSNEQRRAVLSNAVLCQL